MPRLVRRQPLIERIKVYLDPLDLLLWLAEELNDDACDDWLKLWSTFIGLALNMVYILAKGASSSSRGGSRGGDDVFGDDGRSGSGWFGWLASFLVYTLVALSISNALFTFWRRRSYRLFEQAVDVPPPTPSAHRVRVDSSPMSSSPLRYLQAVMSSATASSRAYPDAEREVWELNLWDPKPFNLSIFTLFSPGHIFIYSLLLPPTALDLRPSVTVCKAIAFSALLSAQLWMLKASFSRQAKDSALIHGEVMNEYDTKFVHPNLTRPMRDVGIQSRVSRSTSRVGETGEVDVYTPTTIIKRGFKTHPNPNYAKQYDPDDLASRPAGSRRNSGFLDTPTNGYINGSTQSYSRRSTAATDFSSPLKPHHESLRERSSIKGDGGSMGVYSHAASPLRKAASSNQLKPRDDLRRTLASPLKRMSTSGTDGADPLDRARRRETGRF